jgi:halimadienyl-diphosphate synthase
MVTSLIQPNQRTLALKPQDMALALLEEIVNDFDDNWGSGLITASAYDTAWVAMVRDPHNPKQLAFPDSFDWLLKHQAQDGSWSGPFPFTLIGTLAALLALLNAPEATEQTRYAARRAEAYLRAALSQWWVKNYETACFEVLVPCLLEELEKLGVVFEFPDKAELLKVYADKLRIDGPELIYTGESTLIHCPEAFGPSLDFERLKQQQTANGNYGSSPAGTAAVLIYGPEWNDAAARWLTHLTNRAFEGERGAMPTFYSLEGFEASWSLYYFAHAGFNFKRDFSQQLIQKLVSCLQQNLGPKGASTMHSHTRGAPSDSDSTAMALLALNKAGVNTPTDCLRCFERSNYFACYETERTTSISANAHVLAALLSLPKAAQNQWTTNIAKVVDFLYSHRDSGGFWQDKWHISPYYATSCAVMALAEHEESSVRNKLQQSVHWVLQTQSTIDGGWGYGDCSTLEETAYALLTLQAVPDLGQQLDYQAYRRAIHTGVGYLWQHLDEYQPNYGIRGPKLWRTKEPYTVSRVVFSAVLAAMSNGCLTF